MTRKHLPASLAAASLGVLLCAIPGNAGCLAPSDQTVDTGVGSGPFWGNDQGSLLYARRGVNGRQALVLRPSSGASGTVASAPDGNGFFVANQPETWDFFYSGTINAQDDVAFVASTKTGDNLQTVADEGVSRRGAYARKGNTIYEIARFGNPSPAHDIFGQPIPWGTVFDATAADRDQSGALSVVFSGQYASANDARLGLFQWRDTSSATVAPLLLTGDPSPDGGTFFSIGRLRGNGFGDVAFFAVTKASESSPQSPGLYIRGASGTLSRVVAFGGSGGGAPGGGTFSIAGDFDIDDQAVVTFAATIADGPKKSGLFRAAPPFYSPEVLATEGAVTPLGGTYGPFGSSIVRMNASGEAVFALGLSDDIGRDGLFTIPAASSEAQPLILADQAISAAAIGAGLAAYETPDEIRVVALSDGSEEGPTDFRVVSLDQKDATFGNNDTIRFEGRFLLPAWDTAPPATFRGDAVRFTSTQTLTGAALTKISEVRVSVSSSPGNNFTFGIAGTDAAPAGTYRYNGSAQVVKKLKVATDGSSATWTFSGDPGPGTFSVDLAAGTFKLSLAKATGQPPFLPSTFRVAFFLRSDADVAQALPQEQSWFARDLRIFVQQPSTKGGARVTSKGEGTPGGTVFVDTLKVTRKAAAKGKPAADAVSLAGTLRLCPGTTTPATPTLVATLHLGEMTLDALVLKRVGRKGASYRFIASGTDLRVDLDKGTFSLKTTTAPLAALVNPGAAPNTADHPVGGMELPFSLSIPRVYAASFDVPMVRLKGGKVFSR